MKILLIILACLIFSSAILIALTYPSYHETMTEAQKRLLANSTILKTEHGDIEYTVEGEGKPVLLLHGAGGGYDQGIWAGKVFFGGGYKFVSVSRYGYLRSPIPDNASIESQAAAYKTLLDNLSIGKVIVLEYQLEVRQQLNLQTTILTDAQH